MQFAAAWCILAASVAFAAKTQPALKALVQDHVKPKDLSEEEVVEGALGGNVSIESLVITDKNSSGANTTGVELVPAERSGTLASAPAPLGLDMAPAPAPAAPPLAAPAPAPAPAPVIATTTAEPAQSILWSWLPSFLSPSHLWGFIFGAPPRHTPATLAQIKDLDKAVFAPAPVRPPKEDSTFAPAPLLNSSSTISTFLQQFKLSRKDEGEWSWLLWLWPFQSDEHARQAEHQLTFSRV
ncbi:unnamed protein product [Durusdinium trenchii]|uniref:EF-hand domain-containing protein n=2 Tax=Durusdinium trenchii TaxID=1381693 RepID=A0ABP0L818_9DINO